MKTIDIIRLEKSDQGTFGVLKRDGEVFCVTLEPEDRGNAANVSCIPEGEYTAQRVNSPTFGDTFEITGVPGRSHILFHAGNVEGDTHGCVLLGRSYGHLKGDRAVLSSGATFKAFLAGTSGADSFRVTVRDASGGAA